MTRNAPASEAVLDALPLWGAAGTLALAAFVSARMQPASEMAIHLLVVLAVLAPLAWGLVRGRAELPRAWWISLIAAAALLTLVSFFFTVSDGRSIFRGLSLVSAGVVFGAVLTSRREAGPVVFAALAIAGLGVSAAGANEYAVHARAGDTAWRVFSTFFNPGFLSGFLAFSIPATLALLVAVKERGAALGLGFAAVLQIVALSLTGARAGVLAGALGVAVFAAAVLLGRGCGAQGWRRIALTLLAAVAIAAVVGRPTGERVASPQGEGHSFAFRKYTWAATARMAAARPLTGFGPGSYEVAMQRYAIAGYTRLAHSNYLQAAAESGIPAAVLGFAAWFAIATASAVRLARRSAARESAAYVSAALGASAATAARGLFDSDWWCLPILLSVAAVTGLLAACLTGDGPKHGRRSGAAAGWSLAAVGTAALVLAEMCLLSLTHQTRAEEYERTGDWLAAGEQWAESARKAPWNVRARQRIAEYGAVSEEGTVSESTLREFARIQKLEPTNPKIPTSLADLLLQKGQPEEALKQYGEARKLDPLSPRLLLDEARLLESLGRKKEALALWREMTRVEDGPYGQVRAIPQIVDVTYAWAHAAIGDDLEARRERGRAVEEWRKAADLLQRREESIKEMRPVLEAAGALDPELDEQAADLLDDVRRKIASAAKPGG